MGSHDTELARRATGGEKVLHLSYMHQNLNLL